jgi:hypothetical protein
LLRQGLITLAGTYRMIDDLVEDTYGLAEELQSEDVLPEREAS